MAGLAASLLLKPALDAALAGTAAKGTMDMRPLSHCLLCIQIHHITVVWYRRR